MKRYILTGTPGAGKTTLLRALESRGYAVVEEAATDIIALEQALGTPEPWRSPEFLNKIVRLQIQRQLQTARLQEALQFYDRSPICTLALSRYLRFTPPDSLRLEIERIRREETYEKQVFFVESVGFVEPTAARRISPQEAAIFEEIHREAYQAAGYECIRVPPGRVDERVQVITDKIAELKAT